MQLISEHRMSATWDLEVVEYTLHTKDFLRVNTLDNRLRCHVPKEDQGWFMVLVELIVDSFA